MSRCSDVANIAPAGFLDVCEVPLSVLLQCFVSSGSCAESIPLASVLDDFVTLGVHVARIYTSIQGVDGFRVQVLLNYINPKPWTVHPKP